MGKKKKYQNTSDIFEIQDTNLFLVELESWITRKIPSTLPEIPQEDFLKLMEDLDRIDENINQNSINSEDAINQLTQTLDIYLPSKVAVQPAENQLNEEEILFRAVYTLNSIIYNEGIESYFTYTNENELKNGLKGLEVIGASDFKEKLFHLCILTFGEKYPETEDERKEIVDNDDEHLKLLVQDFCHYYIKNSKMIDDLLASWVKKNREKFR